MRGVRSVRWFAYAVGVAAVATAAPAADPRPAPSAGPTWLPPASPAKLAGQGKAAVPLPLPDGPWPQKADAIPPADLPIPVRPAAASAPPVASPATLPAPEATDRPFPINLATALHLANARPLDVQIAGARVAAAAAAYDRARVLWLPNVVFGADYFAHTGPQQNFAGQIVKQDRNTFMAGLGPNVVFSFSDALYLPLAARQDLNARRAVQQAAVNDTAFAVADAYFGVQQARGELGGALLAERQAEELSRRATALARGLAPPLEEGRARVELARRRQAVASARERWRVASAELARILRLDPAAVFEPVEPPDLAVPLIDPAYTLDDLIPVALATRPELAGQQAVVQATLTRLKQEKIRPLVPSLAIRSASTNPSGSLGYGVFGGGPNGRLADFDQRFDIDAQLLWEFQSLGLGNKARVAERKAERDGATLDLFRTQDRIAAEVAAAFAQIRGAADRMREAEPALKEAVELVAKNLEGLSQTRRVGDVLTLVVRPQEAVAAVQALGQANADYAAAVADYNRAQFRLYRALGHPAHCLAGAVPAVEVAAATTSTTTVPPAATPRPLPAVPATPVTPVTPVPAPASVVPSTPFWPPSTSAKPVVPVAPVTPVPTPPPPVVPVKPPPAPGAAIPAPLAPTPPTDAGRPKFLPEAAAPPPPLRVLTLPPVKPAAPAPGAVAAPPTPVVSSSWVIPASRGGVRLDAPPAVVAPAVHASPPEPLRPPRVSVTRELPIVAPDEADTPAPSPVLPTPSAPAIPPVVLSLPPLIPGAGAAPPRRP